MPPILPERTKTDDRLIGQLYGKAGGGRDYRMEIALPGQRRGEATAGFTINVKSDDWPHFLHADGDSAQLSKSAFFLSVRTRVLPQIVQRWG